MLDLVISQRLREPSPWELEQWRSAQKDARTGWERSFDEARFCYSAEDALREVEAELCWSRRPDGGRRPRSAGGFAEAVRLAYGLARNLYSWMRADYRTLVDYGGGDIRVSAFPDKVALVSEGAVAPNARSVSPAHAFSQGTQALQCLAPSPHGSLNGCLAAKGDRTAGVRYPSTLSAVDWSWTNQDAGTAIYVVHVTPSSFAVGGNQWCVTTISSLGLDFFFTTTSQVQFRVLTAAGTVGRTVSGLATNTPAVARLKHATSLSPDSSLTYTGKTTNSGDYGTGAPTGNPDTTMYVLGASFGNTYDGYVADVLFGRDVTPQFDAVVSRYLQLRYGLA